MNNRLTDWFSVYSGVRHNLGPTLFAIYVHDVITCINQLNVGVPISEKDSISVLLYADDRYSANGSVCRRSSKNAKCPTRMDN